MALEGVRVGPLDPDKGETFGQVGGQNLARQLIRHHQASHPPALVAALQGKHNGPRSKALDRKEVAQAAIEYYADSTAPLPDGVVVTGANVNGEDDNPDRQFACFTWVVPIAEGGSGRSGKGFVPYDEELLPKSVAAGNEATRIAELKEAGLPWQPEGVVQAEAKALDPEAGKIDELLRRVEELSNELTAVRQENAARDEAAEAAALAQAQPSVGGTVVPDPIEEDPTHTETPEAAPTVAAFDEDLDFYGDAFDELSEDDALRLLDSLYDAEDIDEEDADLAVEEVQEWEAEHQKREAILDYEHRVDDEGVTVPAVEADREVEQPSPAPSVGDQPWDGYDDENADSVRRKLREDKDPAVAQKVADYEKANAKRGTVLAQANQILDNPSAE